MSSYTISPIWGAGAQLFDNSGNVLTGGKIYTYLAGTTTPATTYTTPIGSTANTNPIVANAAGRLTNEIWLPITTSYKFVLKDSNDVLIATYDNIPAAPQPAVANDASSIYYEEGYEVTAGNFTVGATYLITSVGNTDFIAIGAASNTTGIHFIATGIGLGTGTAKYSRTVETKLQESISVKDFGAIGDGVTDDSFAFSTAITAIPSGVTSIPNGTYKVSSVVLKQQTQIDGNGAVITPAANSSSIFNLEQSSWQYPTYQGIKNLGIDASGYTGISGITQLITGSGGASALVLENVRVFNYDTVGFDLYFNQFGRFTNLQASGSNSGVGYYLHPTSSGGGANSNTFDSIVAVYNDVGVLVNGAVSTGGTGNWGAIANNFVNPQTNGNGVCAMAFFDAQANIYGGSPEANAQGSASYTYDGKTIPRCSIYLNKSNVNIYGIRLEENNVVNGSPGIYVTNNSTLSLTDCSGYARPGNYTVYCDDSSSVSLNGYFNMLGNFNNVSSWPNNFKTVATVNRNPQFWTALYGTAISEEDSSISYIVSEQAPYFLTYGGAPATQTFVNDDDFGYCTQLAMSSTAQGSVNQYLIPGLTINSDILISFLLKSDKDCTLSSLFNDGVGVRMISNDGKIILKANVPQRVVLSRSDYSAGGGGSLSLINWDTTAPIVKVSNLVVYQGLTAEAKTQENISKIVATGAYNPGVVRATQTQLLDKTSSVNTVNKYPGKQVWDTTNNRVVFSDGRTDVSVWKDGVNSTVYTPV